MVSRDDVQSWLDRLELPVTTVADDLWVVQLSDGGELAVNFAPPVLVLRVRVTELPADAGRFAGMARQLLQWNARDLVHGSYGIEGDHVVLTDTLELGHLDFSEFEASIDSLGLALASHLGALAPYRE
ncbi:MAG TPA: YbjN domain-containing protein [Gemmatimonadales bacterium]|nr:YbjN domain-containing protein [Gemmatimonadales bacterium]